MASSLPISIIGQVHILIFAGWCLVVYFGDDKLIEFNELSVIMLVTKADARRSMRRRPMMVLVLVLVLVVVLLLAFIDLQVRVVEFLI